MTTAIPDVRLSSARTLRSALRSLKLATIALALGLGAGATPLAHADVWFAPHNYYRGAPIGDIGALDFDELFADDAPWKESAALVRVFKLYPQYLNDATDEQLQATFRGLQHRHIALAIEFGILHQRADCGHVEGHNPNQLEIAQRIERLGGKVEYFATDEPLYFGHSFDGKEGCRDPLPALAAEAAGIARAFRSVFPKVKFIDVEPISNFKEPDWVELIVQWHAEFAKAFGEPFYRFDVDVNWRQPWSDRVVAIASRMRREGMRLGLLCNGDPNEATDQAWIDHALQRCESFEDLTGGPPDDVIFQSWVRRPTHVLPEDAPDSFTHLILQYAQSRHLHPVRPQTP